jgi:hypothetical protein
METTGHFAAWEDPDFYVKDIRAFVTVLKK